MKLLALSRADIAKNFGMADAISAMEIAFRELSRGGIEAPLRTALVSKDGTILYKPAFSPALDLFCVKVVSVFPGNAALGEDVTAGTILLNDAKTGLPLALMDAGYLTSLRTGAAAGLATKLLAPEEVAEAALFGTGGQAFHQLEALLAVRKIRIVHVFSRTPANAKKFCDTHAPKFPGVKIIPAENRAVLKRCAVVTTASTAGEPVFDDAELAPHVHINAIGSLGAHRSEIPVATLARARIVVDQRAACLKEAGEIILLINSGRSAESLNLAELGELTGATVSRNTAPVSVFKSVGNAAQDLVCAAEVYRLALAAGVGTTVTL
jgi:ornithine cyclodeaminase